MQLLDVTHSHVIKLASLAVHAEEFFETVQKDPRAARFDRESILGILSDVQVREVLDDPKNAVFLPMKR
jgi:hypothetical protein